MRSCKQTTHNFTLPIFIIFKFIQFKQLINFAKQLTKIQKQLHFFNNTNSSFLIHLLSIDIFALND